jgi:hypothetical protein
VGALYEFGGVLGSLSSDSTISFGLNYANRPLGLGAAYVAVKYPQSDNGNKAIRNFVFFCIASIPIDAYTLACGFKLDGINHEFGASG